MFVQFCFLRDAFRFRSGTMWGEFEELTDGEEKEDIEPTYVAVKLPAGWRSVPSKSRPGENTYVNVYTKERISWCPQIAGSRERGNLPHPPRGTHVEVSRAVSYGATEAGPTGVSASRAATSSRSFNIEVRSRVCCGGCRTDNNVFPPFAPQQWNGRITHDEYMELNEELLEAIQGRFNRPLCAWTLLGCYLFTPCAIVEACGVYERIAHVVETFNARHSDMVLSYFKGLNGYGGWRPAYIHVDIY